MDWWLFTAEFWWVFFKLIFFFHSKLVKIIMGNSTFFELLEKSWIIVYDELISHSNIVWRKGHNSSCLEIIPTNQKFIMKSDKSQHLCSCYSKKLIIKSPKSVNYVTHICLIHFISYFRRVYSIGKQSIGNF